VIVNGRLRLLGIFGPVTIVRAFAASPLERRHAFSPQEAYRVLSDFLREVAYEADHHRVADVLRLIGPAGSRWRSLGESASVGTRVMEAVHRGDLLVLDGWAFGDSWMGGRRGDSPTVAAQGPASAAEGHLARRIMGSRGEIAFEGASYVVLPTLDWDDLRDRGGFEVVHREAAVATLQRMAPHAPSDDARVALGEATRLLADTRAPIVRGGLFLARRRPETAGGLTRGDDSPPVTPSAIRKLAQAAPKPAPHPAPDNVSPVLTISAPKVILVKKPFQHHPHRLMIRLTTDKAFDGTAILSATNAAGIHVYSAAGEAGEGKSFPITAIEGDKLTAGIQLFLEARQPSHALEDVELKLHLDGGTKPRGVDAKGKLTCVELTLDICASRIGPAADPAPLSAADKLAVGRFVQHNDPGFHHGRAKLIVRKPVPAAFAGRLELRGLDGKVQAFAAGQEAPAAGQAAIATGGAPEVIDCAGIPATGHVVWAEGIGTSGAINDTGFGLDLQGQLLPEHADKVAMTVVEFTRVDANIKATPPNTVRAGFPGPADHHFQSATIDPDFAANAPLVLMRNAQPDITLEVTAAPANLPIRWVAVRNAADHASLGGAGALPTVTPDGAHPTKATLAADSRGSFRIRAYIDCNGNNRYNDGEPSIPMNLVLADVSVVNDNSAAFTGHLAAQVTPATVNVRNGTWPASWAAAVGPGGAGMTMELVCDVTGGGADGRLGLDRVLGGLCNMLTGPNINLVYRDATGPAPVDFHIQNIYATNLPAATSAYGGTPMFLPADPAPVLFAVPFLDTGRNPGGIGGETATMSKSGPWDPAPVNRPVGQRWTLRCIDSPGRSFLLQHPTHPAARLFRIHYEQRFRANFCFWTNVGRSRGATGDPADRVYSVVRTMAWTVRGDWNVNVVGGAPVLANTTPHTVAISGPATINPIGRAQDHGVEIRPPSGITMGIGWVTD
jgi:hypothetical protein